MNNIISIAGSSGVGKTTIAKLLHIVLPSNEVVLISGDDLHKWERGNPNWDSLTHLNPEANNLLKGYDDLRLLKQGTEIQRDLYDHDTGKFIKNQIIKPKQNIIYEGLHTLHGIKTCNIADLKIFVDTDEELKVAWKIHRDTKKRGYTRKQAIAAINARQEDERRYINPQKAAADIIVRFRSRNAKIELECELITDLGSEIADQLSEIYQKQREFLFVCQAVAEDEDLVQSKGGNISYKVGDKMIITSSGVSLSSINMFSGHCVCDIQELNNTYADEESYTTSVTASKIFKTKERPSMETGLHSAIGECVLHTHPMHLNMVLCSLQGGSIITRLFGDLDYQFIPYITPGAPLSNFVQNNAKNASVLFLQNHGLVVRSDSLKKCLALTKYINEASRIFIGSRQQKETKTLLCSAEQHLFPDSVALQDESSIVNAYIFDNIIKAGLKPRLLTTQEIQAILSLESEKYRRKI